MPATTASKVIVRFSPLSEDGLAKSIRRQVEVDGQRGISPRHGVSVFATEPGKDEAIADTVKRVCESVSEHAGGRTVSVLSEQTLNQRGYALHLSEPPKDHYLVGNTDLLVSPDVAGMAAAFAEGRQRNPAFGGGNGND